MNKYFSKIREMHRHVDKTFLALYIILLIFSVVALFSSSSSIINQSIAAGHGPLKPILAQIGYLFGGFVIAYSLQFLPSKYYSKIGYVIFAVGLVMLFLNLCGVGLTLNGATRWIRVGGFTIQSSEVAKLGLIIVSTDLLIRIKDKETHNKYFLIVMSLTMVTCFMIMVGNLSTAILLGVVMILIMFMGRVNWLWLLLLIVVVLSLLFGGFYYVKTQYVDKHREMHGIMSRAVTWVNRIDGKLVELKTDDNEIKLTDDNYQSTLARVAVARGGKSPFGVLPGNSLERYYLPLANADYIFAIIVEEYGIFGAFVLCFLYLAILFRCCLTSSKYTDYSAQLLVMGLGVMITTQALLSMMVAVGIVPVTGQPLPLITKGGTSAIITSLYFGMMLGVSRQQHTVMTEAQEAIKESKENVPTIEVEAEEIEQTENIEEQI